MNLKSAFLLAAGVMLLGAGCSSNSTSSSSTSSRSFTINDKAIYLRGEMNDYEVNEAYRLRPSKNGYCTVALLRSDWAPYKFKFADADWTDGTNFGYLNPPGILRNAQTTVELNPNSSYEEINYYPKKDGVYRFCLVVKSGHYYAVVTKTSKNELISMAQLMQLSSKEL